MTYPGDIHLTIRLLLVHGISSIYIYHMYYRSMMRIMSIKKQPTIANNDATTYIALPTLCITWQTE